MGRGRMSPSSVLALFLFILFTTSPCAALSTNTSASLDNFIQCFHALTHFSAAHTVHTNTSALYQSILRSTALNFRFIASTTTRKPAIIVTPEEEGQVAVIVRCAYTYDLQLRVRSGGHDWEGLSYVVVSGDGDKGAYLPFVDVDLSRLSNIDVDTNNRTAWVQAGATLGEVYYNVFTKTGGTAGFPGGASGLPLGNGPTVGVGGHIGSGGIGPMSRRFGTAADNVVDAKLVGTCGEILDREAMGEEVFWAIRGGGAASFGIVLAYKLKLIDVPRNNQVSTFNVTRVILQGSTLSQQATQLLTRWQEVAPILDENLYIDAFVVPIMDISGVVTIFVQYTGFFLGDRSRLASLLSDNFPELGLRESNLKRNNWLEAILYINGMQDQAPEDLLNRTQVFPNASFKVKSDFVTKPITEENWEKIFVSLNRTLINSVLRGQEAVALILQMQPMGGQMSKISEAATPFPHRRGNLYSIWYSTVWFRTDEQATRNHVDLMNNVYNIMTQYVSSNPRAAYYGYKDIELGRNKGVLPSYNQARVWGEKYFKNNFERLARIKRTVDAGNYFRNEQSIPPYNSLEAPESTFLEVSVQCSTNNCMCFTKQ